MKVVVLQVVQCLLELVAGAHHERPVTGDRLAEGRSGDQQKARRALPGLHPHLVAVAEDQQLRRAAVLAVEVAAVAEVAADPEEFASPRNT